MKRIISLIISICLLIVPINIYAAETEKSNIEVVENISSTSSVKTPEEQAIEKIVAHKKANGEKIPSDTRGLTEDIDSGSVYYIKNYFSGKYLNVHYGVDANGTNVYQWTGDSSTEQKFKVVEISPECYKIYAMCSSNGNNRVLDVVRNGKDLASGQNVDIWTPVDDKAQELILTPLIYDNIFHIQMKDKPNFYFTSYGNSNGTSGGKTATSAGNVFIKEFNVNDNQQWQFILISSPTVTPSEPSYSTPYGWLDEVNANGIRGWVWCESHPNLALNVSIKIYNSANVLCETIPLVADLYRQDVEESGRGTGYYGFHTDIAWSEFNPGTYTVKVFAGVSTPNTQIHDSPMTYSVISNVVCVGVIDSAEGHNHLSGFTAAAPYILSSDYYTPDIHHGEFSRDDINNFLNSNENRIFVSRGHGGKVANANGGIAYTYILLNDEIEGQVTARHYNSHVMSQMDLSNMELVMFIGCSTGAGGVGGNNLPTAVVERGAKVAIGFTDTIYCLESNQWTQAFFSLASQGLTVLEIKNCISDSSYYDFVSQNMESSHIVVCGDLNYRLKGFRD